MKIKGRGILVICLLAFGGYTAFDYFQDQKKEESDRQAARLMTLDFDKVDVIQVQRADGQKVIVKRSTEGWSVVEPLQDLADSTVADDFVKNIYPERIIEVANDKDKINWALYGLDKPMGTILLKTADGKQNYFEVSSKRNFEENAYLRRDNENRVLVVNSIWQNRVEKTVMDFRDHRFLRHKIASVDQVKIKNQTGLFEIKRVEGKWQVVNKPDFKIDQNKVRELLTTIADARATQILEGPGKLPATKNLFTMDLVLEDKKWNAQVSQAKDLGIYATVSEPKFSMKMEAGALDKFIKISFKDLQEEPEKAKDKDQQADMVEQKEKL